MSAVTAYKFTCGVKGEKKYTQLEQIKLLRKCKKNKCIEMWEVHNTLFNGWSLSNHVYDWLKHKSGKCGRQRTICIMIGWNLFYV